MFAGVGMKIIFRFYFVVVEFITIMHQLIQSTARKYELNRISHAYNGSAFQLR